MVISAKQLTKFVLYFTLAHIGISYIGLGPLPIELMYICDIAAIFLTILIIKSLRSGVNIGSPWVKRSIYLALLVMVINIMAGVIGLVNPLWLLRGIRSVCRFYILYIGMILYWKKDDVYDFFRYAIKLYPLNFAVVLIQWIVWPDNYDGIIGITGTYLAVYMTLVVSYYTVMYLRGKEPIWKLAIVAVLNFLTAAWGDQRGYYFMFIAAIVTVLLYERKTTKMFTVVIGGSIAIAVGLYIMSIWMPDSYNTLLGIDAIYEYGTRTSGGYEISRFGAFGELNDLFFHNDIFRNLFGYGLGSCEVNSPFYNQYGHLHYTWFTHQWTFLETGYVGIIILVFFFVWHLGMARVSKRECKNQTDQGLVIVCASIATVAIITTMYFSMHRGYHGYLFYALMAMIMILLKENSYEGEDI